ncbi:A disintegrin and metalloproteinase with thrombospondin motifs adt-1 isoform X4 [Hydra vulgaris]|uniref:A disintegrin and metalloproteinase with thrombospondin motifs adt-1 isoform X4 n=1 Tax=Hydra vulgaris TaxID=6087 RepID=UPI0032EA82C9
MLIILVFVISISNISSTFISGLSHELFRFKGVFDMVKTQKPNVYYPRDPDYYKILDHFNATADSENFYGYRIHGWFLAPITGSYRFVNFCEQSFILYLSSDMDPAKKKLILKQVQSSQSSIKQFRVTDMSSSVPVFMEENNIYYIEALFSVMKPANCFSLGVRLPRQSDVVQPIQKDWLSPLRIETCISLDCDQPANEMCIFENKKYVICTCKSGYKILNKAIFCRGIWSDWNNWSSCSALCGDGVMVRTRLCGNTLYPVQCSHGASLNETKNCKIDCNGNWGFWGTWSTCSSSCESGTSKRTRECNNTEYLCDGNKTEFKSCNNIQACNGHWEAWSSWSFCSSSCNSGFTTRVRSCNSSKYLCEGNSTEISICFIKPCEGAWQNWNEWSSCNATCGEGFFKRTRVCNDVYECPGNKVEYFKCYSNKTCPGAWQEWNEWSSCNTTCGQGFVIRTRVCSDIFVCPGNKVEYLKCYSNKTCQGAWQEWNEWSSCNTTCGEGFVNRTRACQHKFVCPGNKIEYLKCYSNKTCQGAWQEWNEWSCCNSTCGEGYVNRTRVCSNIFACPGNKIEYLKCYSNKTCQGVWQEWNEWTSCNSTCGDGFVNRTRICSDVFACPGYKVEFLKCYSNATCQGAWEKWNEWSSCSTTCGDGFVNRTRVCSDVFVCPGNKVEYLKCYSNETCQVKWSHWSKWENCNVSCGYGYKNRTRSCNRKNLFEWCSGESFETNQCFENFTCERNWTNWSEWSICNISCGYGFMNRTRVCNTTYAYEWCLGQSFDNSICYSNRSCIVERQWSPWGGCSKTCGQGIMLRSLLKLNHIDEEVKETQNCSLIMCPVDGGWSEWDNFGPCSKTCGDGLMVRLRHCNKPLPRDGGLYCFGLNIDYRNCELDTICPVHGGWSDWTTWSQCNQPCNGGVMKRFRDCINPIPSSGGRECDGISMDVVSCNMHKCRRATINLVMYFPEEFYADDYAKPNSKPSLILKEKIKYLMNKISEEHLAERYFSVEIHSMKNITMNKTFP